MFQKTETEGGKVIGMHEEILFFGSQKKSLPIVKCSCYMSDKMLLDGFPCKCMWVLGKLYTYLVNENILILNDIDKTVFVVKI